MHYLQVAALAFLEILSKTYDDDLSSISNLKNKKWCQISNQCFPTTQVQARCSLTVTEQCYNEQRLRHVLHYLVHYVFSLTFSALLNLRGQSKAGAVFLQTPFQTVEEY